MFDFHPKTKLGKMLLELRRSYLASGGSLLSPEALDEELRLRRSGVICDDELSDRRELNGNELK